MATAQAASTAGKALGGVAGGTGKLLGGLAIFLKFKVVITIIFLIYFIGGAVAESIEQKNFSPLVFKVGGRILSADETFYLEIKAIEANDWRLPVKNIEAEEEGFWKDIKSVLGKATLVIDFLGTAWFIYIVFWGLFLLLKLHNGSEGFFNVMFAIIIMVFLQAGYSLAMLHIDYDCPNSDCLTREERIIDTTFALTPLKGVGSLFYHLVITQNLVTTFAEPATSVIQKVINDTMQINVSGVF